MNRKNWTRSVLLLVAVIGPALASGCAGQIKAAAVEHAKSTRTVADTLTKVAANIKCEAAQADACAAALTAIQDQAKALRQSADKLEQEAK